MDKLANLFINIGNILIYVVGSRPWGVLLFIGCCGALFLFSDIPNLIINLIYNWIPSIGLIPAQSVVVIVIKYLMFMIFVSISWLVFIVGLGVLGANSRNVGEKINNKDFSFIGTWIWILVFICVAIYSWNKGIFTRES